MRRRILIAVASVVLAGAVAIVATVDHRDKQSRVSSAEISEWYCTHDGTRCGGASSVVIENRWNQREIGYKVAFGGLVAAAVLVAGSALLVPARHAGVPGR